MAIRIKARAGESAEQMLRRFKKLCEKEGLTKDVKRKQFYEKPSERRRRSVRKGGPRPMLAREGGRGGSGGSSGGGRGAARSGGGRSAGGRSGGGRSSGGPR